MVNGFKRYLAKDTSNTKIFYFNTDYKWSIYSKNSNSTNSEFLFNTIEEAKTILQIFIKTTAMSKNTCLHCLNPHCTIETCPTIYRCNTNNMAKLIPCSNPLCYNDGILKNPQLPLCPILVYTT